MLCVMCVVQLKSANQGIELDNEIMLNLSLQRRIQVCVYDRGIVCVCDVYLSGGMLHMCACITTMCTCCADVCRTIDTDGGAIHRTHQHVRF